MGRILDLDGGMDPIRFSVCGNPIPYLRMTQGQVRLMHIPEERLRPHVLKVVRRIRAYLNYKDEVYLFSKKWPIDRAPKIKVYLNVMIYFSGARHADPENIRKGIQDAIFVNDRMVAGAVDFDYDAEKPRVEIEIRQN